MEKIAVVCDTACDISLEEAKKLNIELIPLHIIYKDREYLDAFEISPKEVYDRFEEEIPTTSLPSEFEMVEIFKSLKNKGYEKFIVITISSGLSGTFNTAKSALLSTGFEHFCFDTKKIGIMSGVFAKFAATLRNEGYSFVEIRDLLIKNFHNSKGYYTLETLKYLIKGGRIGKVSGVLAGVLNILPIISCNEDGIYYNVAKVRGKKNVYKKMAELIKKDAIGDYEIYLCHGNNKDGLEEIKKYLYDEIRNAKDYRENQITATLGVHTGESLVGAVVFSKNVR